MKTINETFSDMEHNALFKKKNGMSWHDFILTLLKGGMKDGNRIKNTRRN